MIVSYSTIEEAGAGFRSRLFIPRWKAVQEKLKLVDLGLPGVSAIRALIIIGRVDFGQRILGVEGESFVVEARIPIEEFKKLTIGEKNNLVLDTIFKSIKAVCENFGSGLPRKVSLIWQGASAIGENRIE